ncbi:Aromatic-di-Alanine repeat protein, partial [Opisthorchis viverrini]|uniref:Gamma-soluble NSF attachment protein n=2 Tax=Opisthorchis viverrini TaxID=6198 RepID=A0A074ZGP8_OPIVI
MSAKLDEANEWIGKAEKSLKTSLFKRTPDYDSAIEYYTKAALLFRNAKQLERSAQLYEKVAELQLKHGSFFHAAKNYETASLLYRDLKDFDRMAELVTQAGELLRKCGAPDSASYLYEKTAKPLEQPLPERAAQFYELAADSCEVEEKYHAAADQCNNAARVWVRIRRFAEAERLLRLYIDYTEKGNPSSTYATLSGLADNTAVPKICARAVLVLILMKLHQGDEVAAGKIYSEAVQRWRFLEADENLSVRRLLGAFEECDGAAAAQAIKEPCFRTLDLDYARLVNEIKLPKVQTVKPKTERPTEPFVSSDGYSSPGSDRYDADSGNQNAVEEEEEEDIC